MTKNLRDWRIVEEIKIKILRTMENFQSEEHPKSKITDLHFNKALISILEKKINRSK